MTAVVVGGGGGMKGDLGKKHADEKPEIVHFYLVNA